jgi:hypothetical protein
MAFISKDGYPGVTGTCRARGIAASLRERRGGQKEARYRHLSKGFSDSQAGIGSPDVEEMRRVFGTLAVEEFPAFIEEFLQYNGYSHGTHVAGIAVAGSPVAHIVTVRDTYGWCRAVPGLQTLELVQAEAHKFYEIVAYLRASGARVVNMSWTYSAQDYEDILERRLGLRFGMGSEIANLLAQSPTPHAHCGSRHAERFSKYARANNGSTDGKRCMQRRGSPHLRLEHACHLVRVQLEN